MEREPLKIGDRIAVTIEGQEKPVDGEVVTFRIAGRRQILNLKTEHGIRTMVLLLSGHPKAAVVVPPIDPQAVRSLAFSVLADQERGIPITSSVNILAAAVIALTGDAA